MIGWATLIDPNPAQKRMKRKRFFGENLAHAARSLDIAAGNRLLADER
jgi:hypothetical protein